MKDKKTLAEHARDVMLEEGVDCIWRGMFGLCDEIYSRSNGKIGHPVARQHAVIASIRKSSLFEPAGKIRAASGLKSNREVLHSRFKLKRNAILGNSYLHLISDGI